MKRTLLVLAFFLALPAAVWGQTNYVWNGTSGNWSNTAKWTPSGNYPGQLSNADTATISSSSPVVTIDGDYTLGAIVGSASGYFTNTTAHTLTLTTAGTAISYSGANATYGLIYPAGNLTINATNSSVVGINTATGRVISVSAGTTTVNGNPSGIGFENNGSLSAFGISGGYFVVSAGTAFCLGPGATAGSGGASASGAGKCYVYGALVNSNSTVTTGAAFNVNGGYVNWAPGSGNGGVLCLSVTGLSLYCTSGTLNIQPASLPSTGSVLSTAATYGYTLSPNTPTYVTAPQNEVASGYTYGVSNGSTGTYSGGGGAMVTLSTGGTMSGGTLNLSGGTNQLSVWPISSGTTATGTLFSGTTLTGSSVLSTAGTYDIGGTVYTPGLTITPSSAITISSSAAASVTVNYLFGSDEQKQQPLIPSRIPRIEPTDHWILTRAPQLEEEKRTTQRGTP